MNDRPGERLAVVKIAATLAVTLQLGGCGTGSPPAAAWRDQAAAVAVALVDPTAPEPAVAPPVRAIEAIPRRKPRRPETSAPAASAGVLPQAEASLAWPVHGRIRRGFGQQPSGARNDGLDIATEAGAAVRAVEDGVVSYAGGDLPGYGNMLLVAHPRGYTSVYAHNRTLLVAVGAAVRRGQPIATVGRHGDPAEVLLHFQLRAGERPVDPEPYLEPAVTVVAGLAATAAGGVGTR